MDTKLNIEEFKQSLFDLRIKNIIFMNMVEYKDYFNKSQKEKDVIIDFITSRIKLNSDIMPKDDIIRAYKNNFTMRKIAALRDEDYELCDIIDKVLNKLDDAV